MSATLALMRVLVSGFEPFGGDVANASGDAVRALAEGWADPSLELHTVVLPVTFEGAPRALADAIRHTRPDAVLCVGEAGGRSVVTPERWAVNERDARIPDNDGRQPSGPIDDGPRALASRVDVDALVAAMRAAGVPAEPSEDAGRFVCNAIFRAALTAFDGPAGFIHVPAVRSEGVALVGAETDSQPVGAALTVADLVSALTAAVEAVRMTTWEAST